MTSSPASQVQRRMARLSYELARSQRSAVESAAFASKKVHETERDKAVGADGRMSGVGTRGAKLGVRYDVKGRGGGRVVARLNATGPWQLIERSTRPHIITAKGNRGSRRSRAAAVRSGNTKGLRKPIVVGGDPYAYARHPGTAGKRPWGKAVRKVRRRNGPAFRAIERPMGAAFRRGLR